MRRHVPHAPALGRSRQLGARPRAFLATLPLLASLTILTCAVLLGAFNPAERALAPWLSALWPAAELSPDVVLVELDAATLDELGAPPWSPVAWERIGEALAKGGLADGLVVDPASRLILDDPGAGEVPADGAATLRVIGSADVPAPLVPAGFDLPLPTQRGVLTGIGAAASSPGWCTLARCPTGPPSHQPLAASELDQLPRLSLADLLAGRVRTVIGPDAVVLVGLTAPDWAATVPVGSDGRVVARAEATALALATLRERSPRPHATLAVVLPLVALLVLLGALVAHLEPLVPGEAWIAILPAGVVVVVVALAGLGLVQVPLTPLVAAALLGPLSETLRLRARTARFLERLAQRLARTEIGVPRAPEPTPEGVLQQLASLTWNHLPTDRMLYLHRVGGHGRVVGGFGLTAAELDLPERAAELDRLARIPRADIARDRTLAVTVVAVPTHGEQTLGWWVVAWDAAEVAPSTARLADLARWVGLEIAARPVTDTFTRLLHTDLQLDAIEAALHRSEQARHRQRTLLQTAELPLAFVDRSGTLVYQNQAFDDHFRGEASPRSLRELLFRATGPEGLSTRMRGLFGEGRALRVPWPDRGVDICAAASADEARSGVLVWLEGTAARSDEGSAAAK